MNQKIPQLSVVMPAYNSAPYIKESIESVLAQSMMDFEFIIVNDGSTDDTEKIIQSFEDRRIRYYANPVNIGNNLTRNYAMSLASAPYLAIADSDDIMEPRRLETQFNWMESHPKTDILGGWVIRFGMAKEMRLQFPTDPDFINASLLFRNVMSQPTAMLRRESILNHNLAYLPEWENLGDFDLWYRASIKGLHLENLPFFFTRYRQWENQIGERNKDDRNLKFLKHLALRLGNLEVKLNDDDLLLLADFIRSHPSINHGQFARLEDIFNSIEKSNQNLKRYSQMALIAVLLHQRLRLGKYFYLEYKRSKSKFALFIIRQISKSGISAFLMMQRNTVFK